MIKKICIICKQPVKKDDSVCYVKDFDFGLTHLDCALKEMKKADCKEEEKDIE